MERATPLPKGNRGIHGISTHKVYPPGTLLRRGVRSYRTFSPLPPPERWRLFSVTRSVSPLRESPSVRWCGALRCPDFPHSRQRRDRDRAACKTGNLRPNIMERKKKTHNFTHCEAIGPTSGNL